MEDFKESIEYEVTVKRIRRFIQHHSTTYESVPKAPHVATESKTVFQQTSEKTDILALIAAVNGVTFRD